MTAKPLSFPPRSGSYLALVTEAIDGDTIRFFWLVEDVGRLIGVNAPENYGVTKPAGQAAKEFLAGQIDAWPVVVDCWGREKYGRALITLHDKDGASVNQKILDAGHGIPSGKMRLEIDPCESPKHSE